MRLLGRLVECKHSLSLWRVIFWRALSRSNGPKDPLTVLLAMTGARDTLRNSDEKKLKSSASLAVVMKSKTPGPSCSKAG